FDVFPSIRGSRFEGAFRRAVERGTPVRVQGPSVITDRIVELHVYPGQDNLTVLFRDVTERELQAMQVERLTKLYAVLSQVNETIVRTRETSVLFSQVCAIVAAQMAFPLAWIGLVEGRTVRPVASGGTATDYLAESKVETAGIWGQGPTGTCIRENRAVVNDSFSTNPLMSPWRESAMRHGLLTSAAVPLQRQGKVVGALTICSDKQTAFDQEQVKLIEALGADISYWLDAIEADRLRSQAEQALRESERELRAADMRKNDFLAMLSHELRNPLTPIRNSLYLLEHGRGDPQQTERAESVIGRQVAHLTRLVDDLLDVTRISRGKIQLEKEDCDLDELVGRTVEDHRDLFAGNGVELSFKPSGVRLMVHGDRTRIAQVVGNLLANSVKFTPRGGVTTVWVESRAEARAAVRVQDSGTGINAEILPHLFEPFVQADRTLDRSKGGLGLGLALVKGLAEMHGGAATARSEGPGKGAEFEIVLPTLLTPTRVEPRPPPVEPLLTPRRIL
ncbi:MAG TPA: GAF domain-containing sensor histidine kinase, partial [Polyangia bacterium]